MKIEEIIPLLRQGGYCTIGLTDSKFSLEELNDSVVYNCLTREDYTYFPALKKKPRSETYPNMDIGYLKEVWKGYVHVNEYSFHSFAEEFGFNPREVLEFSNSRDKYE